MTDADLEEIGYAEIQHRFERGDYHEPDELKAVKKWLRAQVKERQLLAACERASISSALEAAQTARRANFIAILAVAISAIAAQEEIGALFKMVLNSVKP